MILIDQIRDLIAAGETEKSLHELYKYVKENNANIIDNLVLLRSRMQNLQGAIQNGTIDNEDAAIERAKINEAILKLLPQLTPEYLAQAQQKVEVIQQPEAVVGGSLTPPAGTLLYDVIADHAGYAIWKSDYSEVNGQSIFRIESNKVCQEIKNNRVVTSFEIVANSARYVTLFDPERQLFIRIGESFSQFNNEGEDTWYDLYTGEWTTPADAHWTTPASEK